MWLKWSPVKTHKNFDVSRRNEWLDGQTDRPERMSGPSFWLGFGTVFIFILLCCFRFRWHRHIFVGFLYPPTLSVALFRNKFVILSEWCFRITPTNEHEWIWMNMKIIWNIEILKIVPVIRPSPSPISHTPTLHTPHSTHSRLLSSSRVFEQFIFTIYNSHAFFGLSRSLPVGPSSGVGLWMYDGECRMFVSVQSIVGLAGWTKDIIQWQKWNRK